MTRLNSSVLSISSMLATAALCGVTLGQAAPTKPADSTKPTDAAKQSNSPAAASGKDAPKSLDDVLGIPSATKPAGVPPSGGATEGNDTQPALDKARDRVEKALDEKALDDLMRQALGGMRVSADRLANETDAGLGTQRAQQDVIAKLDTLIDEAKKRCKGGQSTGGGECNSSGEAKKPGEKAGSKPGEKDGENKPGASKSKQEAKKAGENAGSSASGGGAEPAPLEAESNGKILDESRAEWGNLPERVRDLIRQGSRDRIASMYQRLTEEYYRRMAEDASK